MLEANAPTSMSSESRDEKKVNLPVAGSPAQRPRLNKQHGLFKSIVLNQIDRLELSTTTTSAIPFTEIVFQIGI